VAAREHGKIISSCRFIEDAANNYNISMLTSLTIWKFLFSNNNIKVEMVLSSWNNFIWFLLHFIAVRSGHDKRLGKISFRAVFLILWW